MPGKLNHCVYVLLSGADNHFYTGYTTDLKRRLTEHFDGRNTSTACRRPFRLIFCEYYFAKGDALRREAYFKTTAGKRTLRLMLQDSLAELPGRSRLSPRLKAANQRIEKGSPPAHIVAVQHVPCRFGALLQGAPVSPPFRRPFPPCRGSVTTAIHSPHVSDSGLASSETAGCRDEYARDPERHLRLRYVSRRLD